MKHLGAIKWWLTEPNPPILVLWGPQASGKSVLAKAIIQLMPDARTLKVGDFKLHAEAWLLSPKQIYEINDLKDLGALVGRMMILIEMSPLEPGAWRPCNEAVMDMEELLR